MKSLNSLDAFAIRRDMKKNIGLKEYCITYGCSEDDLIYHIRRIFISDTDADNIVKRLRKISDKNEAELERRARKSQKQSLKQLEDASREADEGATNPEDGENTSAETSTSSPDPLAVLHVQEQALSDEIMRLESEHKRLNGLHCECLDQMRSIQNEIETIREILKEKGAAYEHIVERNNQLIQSMNDISLRHRDQLTTLNDIRQEIKALTIIEVFVYTDGSIEPVDATVNLSMDDTGSEELYTDLSHRNDFQDLRMRDLRALARTVRIVSNSETRIRPTFEDDSLEPFYQSLMAQISPAV